MHEWQPIGIEIENGLPWVIWRCRQCRKKFQTAHPPPDGSEPSPCEPMEDK